MLDENTNTHVPPHKLRPLHINCDAIEPRYQHNVSPISTQPTLNPSIFSAEEEPKRNQYSTSYVLSKLKHIPTHLANLFSCNNANTPQHRISEKSRGKMAMQFEGSNSDKVVRHSYSDPRLSPGSTAVGDEEDSHRLSYFTVLDKKKKRSTRRWLVAALMILFGALMAVTFVLVGLGKAASHQASPPTSSSSSVQAQSSVTIASTLQPSSTITTTTTTTTIRSHSLSPTITSRVTSTKSVTDTITKVLIVDSSKYKSAATSVI
ncbi:hypothetical protein K501DRAFT_268078 [Backusella circina FSU 941]|nr:hypothetical protein K501DRAFT_268078 [Backusella circina FSU 941]